MSAIVLCLCHTKTVRQGYLATCQVALVNGEPPEWIELIPAGAEIDALDGRKFLNADPASIVAKFAAHPYDIPIDYEHASEIKGPKGEPAPAAGWINQLEVRNGAVWGHVKWTEKGKSSLLSQEYRYLSPAFLHSKKMEIMSLVSAGLTNRPALVLKALAHASDDVDEVLDSEVALAAWTAATINDLPDNAFLLVEAGGKKDADGRTELRSLRHFPFKGADGQVDLPHLRNAIARIPQAKIEGFTPEKVEALQKKAQKLLNEVNAATEKAAAHFSLEENMDPKLLALLGLAADATLEQVIAACSTLKDAGEKAVAELATARSQQQSLDKFVPRADYNTALARAEKAEKSIAEESAKTLAAAVDAEIDVALKAGKITPATVEYHKALCSVAGGLERFKTFVAAAPVVAADSDLDGKPAPNADKKTLSEEQLAVARNCGLTGEQYLAAL